MNVNSEAPLDTFSMSLKLINRFLHSIVPMNELTPFAARFARLLPLNINKVEGGGSGSNIEKVLDGSGSKVIIKKWFWFQYRKGFAWFWFQCPGIKKQVFVTI